MIVAADEGPDGVVDNADGVGEYVGERCEKCVRRGPIGEWMYTEYYNVSVAPPVASQDSEQKRTDKWLSTTAMKRPHGLQLMFWTSLACRLKFCDISLDTPVFTSARHD